METVNGVEIRSIADEDIVEVNKKQSPLVIGLLILGLLYALFIAFAFYSPRKIVMTVDKAYWTSSANVFKYNVYTREDSYLPAFAELVKIEDVNTGYESVLDHYEDVEETKKVFKGTETVMVKVKNEDDTYVEVPKEMAIYEDMTYITKRPVYIRRPHYSRIYYYNVGQWDLDRTVQEEGTSGEPYFGNFNLHEGEKVRDKSIGYYVKGKSTGKEFYLKDDVTMTRELRISKDDLDRLTPGDKFEFLVIGNKVISWKPVIDTL